MAALNDALEGGDDDFFDENICLFSNNKLNL